jgi:hypothetical protein
MITATDGERGAINKRDGTLPVPRMPGFPHRHSTRNNQPLNSAVCQEGRVIS